MFVTGACRLIGRVLSVACGMYRHDFIGVCQLPGRVLSVACGMYRYACYRCVSVAWESAVGQVGCCSRASSPGQFCSAYSSGENQSHDCCNVHCNLFDNNLSVTHCNILAKLPGEFIGNGGGWYRMGKPVGIRSNAFLYVLLA